MPSAAAWPDVPARLLEAVEVEVGSRVVVVEEVAAPAPGVTAAVLSFADGTQGAASVVAAAASPWAHEVLGREAGVLRVLPATVPHAPLLTSVAHGDHLCVVTEAPPGVALGPPWHSGGIVAAADAVRRTAAQAAPPSLPPAGERLPDLDAWAHLLAGAPELLDASEVSRGQALVAMSDGWRTWTRGDRLVHLDVRGDTAVGSGEDAVLVGWGHAGAGASWLDEALLALDVVAGGHVGGPRTAVDTAVGVLAHLPYEATRFVVAQIGAERRSALLPPGEEPDPEVPGHRVGAERAARLRLLLDRLVSR